MKRIALIALFAVGCAHETPKAQPEKDETEPETASAPAPSAPTPTLTTPSGVVVSPTAQPITGPPPRPRPVKIKIVVRSNPPKANVFWGKKNLGPTPVTLERPRDSGPVDLVVRNDGYLPVHTRAYTFRNDGILVRLTKIEDRMTLPGAKHEANETPPPGGAPEGEAPAIPSPTPPPPGAPPAAPQ